MKGSKFSINLGMGWAILAALSVTGCKPSALRDSDNPLSAYAQYSTIQVSNSISIVASGGCTPYTYSVSSGSGTISSSGRYTAPGAAGVEVVTVTDCGGGSVSVTITVNAALQITAGTDTQPALLTGESHTFSASGGAGGNTFSVVSGTGTIGGQSGTYTASSTIETFQIRVTDSIGNTADAYGTGLAGAEVWFNASDMNGNRDGNSGWSDSDPVTSWASGVSGGITADQGMAARQPVFLSNVAALNNKPAVDFLGSDCLEVSSDFHNETAFTILSVGKADGAGTQYGYWNAGAGTISYGYGANATFGVSIGVDAAAVSRIPASGAGEASSYHIASMRQPASGSFLQYWVNEVAYTHNAVSAYSPGDASGGTSPFLGAQSTDCGTNSLTGEIAEFLYFGSELGLSEMTAVICYYNNVYSLGVGGCSF